MVVVYVVVAVVVAVVVDGCCCCCLHFLLYQCILVRLAHYNSLLAREARGSNSRNSETSVGGTSLWSEWEILKTVRIGDAGTGKHGNLRNLKTLR